MISYVTLVVGGWLSVLEAAIDEGALCLDTSAGDEDGDGIADPCDPVGRCVDVDGLRASAVIAKVLVKRINVDTVEGNDGLRIVAQFPLPAGRRFSTLDPLRRPPALKLERADGSVVMEAALVSSTSDAVDGPIWRKNTRTLKWVYSDESSEPVAGIRRAVITHLVETSLRELRVVVTGGGGSYPVDWGDEPLAATVLVGDGSVGECAILSFAVGECRFGRNAKNISCKR